VKLLDDPFSTPSRCREFSLCRIYTGYVFHPASLSDEGRRVYSQEQINLVSPMAAIFLYLVLRIKVGVELHLRFLYTHSWLVTWANSVPEYSVI
jgi:hypothetical protein